MERKNIFSAIILTILCSFVFIAAYSHDDHSFSLVGYWKTFDKKTHKPIAIVQLWKTDDVIKGKIVKVFSENTLCNQCTGENKNKPITDMIIMSGLIAKQNQWSHGKIFNTENGRTYSCTIKPLDHGKRLLVRRFTGLPIVGSSQVWERVDLI